MDHAPADSLPKPRRRRRRLVSIGVTLALAIVTSLLLTARAPSEPAEERVRSLRGESLEGRPVSMELGGRITVINVWASWCRECLLEAPALRRVWEAERERGVVFVGVNDQDVRSEARSFRREHGLGYPIIFDPTGELRYRLRAIVPTTIVIGTDGRVVLRHLGPIDEQALLDAIQEARSTVR